MSHSDKPLQEQAFTFGGHTLRVVCRRLPAEVARVTQTLQLDVEELFANLLSWDTEPSSPGATAAAAAAAAGGPSPPPPAAADGNSVDSSSSSRAEQQDGAAAVDSKKLCGNVASDQPDLVGLDVWPAAVALCEYLAARPHLAAGTTVCELGAGMGLPGLLCAALGASHVLLTDYEPVVVDQLRANAALNSLQQRCSFLALDWFDLAPLAPAQRGIHDLLLLADVIYAAAVVRPLVATLLVLLKAGTGVALVAHRIRRPLIFDRVDKIARLQERDEIFEDFKAACLAEGLQLRFLNDGPAAQTGDEPLLLVIGADVGQLARFSTVGEDTAVSSAASAAVTVPAAEAEGAAGRGSSGAVGEGADCAAANASGL